MSTSDKLISPAEVQEFLENVLKLESPLERLSQDRAGFLQDFITASYRRVPFQSVTAIATPRAERRALTDAEIKANMLARRGGICLELNRFVKVVLESLGFDIHHVNCHGFGKRNNHMANVVRDLTAPGDLHLVDVGTGYPTFRAVPLNVDKELPVYRDSFLIHKYVKDPSGSLRWMHNVQRQYGDCLPGPMVPDTWYEFIEFERDPKEFEFFHPSMENIHTVESGPEALAPFLVSLRAVDYRGGRLVAIKDTKLLEEDAGGQVRTTRLSSPEELLEAYRVHFPQLPEEAVKRAVENVSSSYYGS